MLRNDDPWEWPSSRGGRLRYMQNLRPSTEQRTENRSALAKIAHVWHHLTNLDVKIVTTCGSVGKKTDSTLCSDLDLVIYVNNLQARDLTQKIPTILDEIQAAMDQKYPNTRDKDWYRKFGLRYNIKGLEIDILVGAPDVVPRDVFDIVEPEQRKFMSASVSHLAKRFIAKQNILFKDLVRVVKHWRDSYVNWPPTCKPKSYLLELVMLHVFLKKKFHLGNTSTGQTFRDWCPHWWADRLLKDFFLVLSQVPRYDDQAAKHSSDNLPNLCVYFEVYYSWKDVMAHYGRGGEPLFAQIKPQGKRRNGSAKTKYATAIVLDPVNPANNVWLSLGDSGAVLTDRARKTYNNLMET